VKKTKASKSAASSTARPIPAGSGPMSVGLLEQIVKLMTTNDLSTVDLTDGNQRILLKRGTEVVAGPALTYASMPMAAPTSVGSASGTPTSTTAPVDDTAGNIAIKSPMVGTFYARSTPDAKPFVAVGSLINEETDVCIIEAMKVFNNIKAEVKGTVVKVLAEDGKPVEFGQVLFLVKP